MNVKSMCSLCFRLGSLQWLPVRAAPARLDKNDHRESGARQNALALMTAKLATRLRISERRLPRPGRPADKAVLFVLCLGRFLPRLNPHAAAAQRVRVILDLRLAMPEQSFGVVLLQHAQRAADLMAVFAEHRDLRAFRRVAEECIEHLFHASQIGLDLAGDLRKQHSLLRASSTCPRGAAKAPSTAPRSSAEGGGSARLSILPLRVSGSASRRTKAEGTR